MGKWQAILGVALAIVTAGCGTLNPASPSAPTVAPPPPLQPAEASPPPATLAISATGVGGPCDVVFPISCAYAITIDGPGGAHHEGWFDYDPVATAPGPAGGVAGDIPATLGPGTWTLTFSREHWGDTMSYRPVAGGTPLAVHDGTVLVSCSTTVNAGGAIGIAVAVAFTKKACTVTGSISIP
jgi:hypothetical protein